MTNNDSTPRMTKPLTAGERYTVTGLDKPIVSHKKGTIIATGGDRVTLVAINGDIAICDNRNKTRFSINKKHLS